MYTTIAIVLGVILDFMFGDPQGRIHPVILIGKLISKMERILRKMFSHTSKSLIFAGSVMWLIVVLVSMIVPAMILWAWKISPFCYSIVASFMCYQIMATKSLKDESMKVYDALKKQDVELARKQVSMIVGRDTEKLDETGIIKAAVETVAENTSDGSIAPLFYMAIGGPVLGFFYKAVNTMDSMVGYKNERYFDFGKTAAKLDDLFNFLPSRLAALFMIIAAFLCKFDGRNAWKIYWRDRKKSPSPNSAQTESVCAGALGVRLLGDTSYFGKIYHKQTVGDALRLVETEDIWRANKLLYMTVILGAIFFLGFRVFILLLL